MSTVIRYNTSDQLAVISIDNPPVNASSQQVRQQLCDAFEKAKFEKDIKAIILTGVGRNFMAGADIREFQLTDIPAPDPNEIHATVESMPIPVIAALHGSVLGGGLELALSCHYRVAHSKTQLGLPEVSLGVIPGSGGTQRLPRMIDGRDALDLIVSGGPISAEQALALKLVDRCTDDDVVSAAHTLAHELLDAARGPDLGKRIASRLPMKFSDETNTALHELDKKLPPKERGSHAQRACVEAFRAAELPFAEGLKIEREIFMRCKGSAESKALRHAFFAQREAMKIPDLPAGASTPIRIKNVGLIGAGTMGAGIAISFASADYDVTLVDLSQENLEKARTGIEATFERSVKSGRLQQKNAKAAMERIAFITDDKSLADKDLIIEAVFENMDIKKSIFERLGNIARPDALLASNTSSLDINVLAQASGREQNVLGLHFFSPANIMRLLEVVKGDATSPRTLATAVDLARRIGKVPVISGVCFGFIGNRMLEPYVRESEFLMMEGATPRFIDDALEEFGMAMGPCRMMDMAGIDIGAKIVIEQKKVGALPNDPAYRAIVQGFHALGRHGQKTGCGYYRYIGRERHDEEEVIQLTREIATKHGVKQRGNITREEVVERCLLPLIAEGFQLLDERVAYRLGDIDTVWLNGYGFPRWRGGPMFYAETLGYSTVANKIRGYAKSQGNAFGYWDASHIPSSGSMQNSVAPC